MADIGSSSQMEIKSYPETWESFGSNMDKFIDRKRNELANDNYDLILGFTRGGYIVALVLSTLLRDKIKEVYDIEEKPYKASVRSIPPGIATKRYRHPCFVMQDAASKEDMDDLHSDALEFDLRRFKRSIEEEYFTKIDKLNVLLVDDNLTGSTRLLTFSDEMDGWNFINVKTLCYVRHKVFKKPELDYYVSSFPEGFDFFVMPWHKEEKPKDMFVDTRNQKFAFKINKNINFNMERFQKRLRKLNPPYELLHEDTSENIFAFGRGETIIMVKIEEEDILFNHLYNKIYPPKKCLIQKEPGFQKTTGLGGALSICENNRELILHTNACFLCAFLNCNHDFVRSLILENEPVKELTISPLYILAPPNEVKLIELAGNWFKENYPLLKISSVTTDPKPGVE